MNPTSLSPSSEHRLFSDASGQVIDLVSDAPQMPLSPRWEPSGLSDRPAMETLRAELCVPLSPGEPTLSPSGISSSPGYQSIVTDFRVFPWGVSNTMPIDIMNLLKDDNLARPILRKQLGLFWGRGPQLYLDGQPSDLPPRLLKDSRWRHLLLGCMTDYFHTACAAALVVMRADMSSPAYVRYLPVWQVRLAVAADDPGIVPTHAVVGDFSGTFSTAGAVEPSVYPLYDPSLGRLPTVPVSVVWMQDVDFFANPYPLPVFAGGQEWIRRAIESPRIISSFIDNNMSIRWIVHVPSRYWDDLKSAIYESSAREGRTTAEAEQLFNTERRRIIDEFVNLLSGKRNVGKAIILQTATEILSNNSVYEYKWNIEQVDLKVGDFIKTMIEIGDSADAKKTGAFSLHAALANVGQSGRADSGSEQLYAYNNHLFSSVSIPQMVVVDTLSDTFSTLSGMRLDIRFDRPIQQRQEDLSTSDRLSVQSV